MAFVKLTEEQLTSIKREIEGDNFGIFGEAGTGKSFIVKEICKAKGYDIQVLCSTGIACEVFNSITLSRPAMTMHSFLGVGTAQGPFDYIVQKAVENEVVRKRISETKCVIWDECSMSSARLLELYHAISFKIRGTLKPFGGIQTIIVGDWLQLKPVADKFDGGSLMLKSPLFHKLVPHSITLNAIHRQDPADEKFMALLSEVRRGQCSERSSETIRELKRNLDAEDDAVHLYYMNYRVDAHSAMRLAQMPGEAESFSAKDCGNLTGMTYLPPTFANFKCGAPIMLLYNINSFIHNGTTGTFVRKINEDSAVVLVNGAEHIVSRVSWVNVNEQGMKIGSRSQIPIKLKVHLTPYFVPI